MSILNIEYEQDGFFLEQKFKEKSFKSFISFDYTTSKIGYSNNTGYSYIILITLFAVLLIFYFSNNIFTISTMAIIGVVIYYTYECVTSFKRYKTLNIKYFGEIFFDKNEYKLIDEILEKRNKYFYDKYFMKVNTYSDDDKTDTLNWLYKEEVVNKFEILKIYGVNYNEETDKFYLKNKIV